MNDTALKIDPPKGVCHLCFKIENSVILNANNVPERKYIQTLKLKKTQWTPVNICSCCYVIVKNYSNLLKSASYKIRKYRKLKRRAIAEKKRHGNVSVSTADDRDKVSGEANHSERTNVCDTTESVSEHVTPNKDVKMKQKKKVMAVRKNSAPSTSNVLPQSIVNGMSESCTAQQVNSSLEVSNVDHDDRLSSSRKLKRSVNRDSKIIPHSFKRSKLANYPRSKLTEISDGVITTNKKQVLQNSESSNCLNATETRVSHIDNPSNKDDCSEHDSVTVEDIIVSSSVEKNNIVSKQSGSVNSNVNKELLPKPKKKPGPKYKPGSRNTNLTKILANMPSGSKPANKTAQDRLTIHDTEMRKQSGGSHTPNPKESNDIDTNNQKINRNSINKENNIKKSRNNTAKHNQAYSRNTNNGIQSTEFLLHEGSYLIRKVKGVIKVDKATQINRAIEKPIRCTRNENRVQKATKTKDSTITARTLRNPRVVSKSPSKTALSLSNNAVASTSQPKASKSRIKVKDANLLFNDKPNIVTENLSNGLQVNTVSNSINNRSSYKLTNSDCAGGNSQVVRETENIIPLHDVIIGSERNERKQSQDLFSQAVQEQIEDISRNIEEELPVDNIKREVESFITPEISGVEIPTEETLPNGMQVRELSGEAFLIGRQVDLNSDETNNISTTSHGQSHISPSARQQPPESLPEVISETRYVNEYVYPEVTNSLIILFCRICNFIINSGLDYKIHKKVCKKCRIGYRQYLAKKFVRGERGTN